MPQLPRIVPQSVKTLPVYDFSGGYHATDSQFIIRDNEASDGLNMVLSEDNRWLGRGGFYHFGNSLGKASTGVDSIKGLTFFYHTSTGTKNFACFWGGDIYLQIDGIIAGGYHEWIPQNRTLTASISKGYFLYKDDVLYFCNGYDVMQKYTHATTTWSTLPNFPVASATSSDEPNGITAFKSRIIVWNTTSHPRRVYYSDAGAETIGANNYFDLDDTVLHCESVNDDFLLIFTASGLYRINSFIFSGSTFDPDKIDKISNKRIANRGSIAQSNGIVFFSTLSGIYETDGVVTKNISKQLVPPLGYIGTDYDFTISSACVFLNYYIVSTSTLFYIYDINRGIWFVPSQKAGSDETSGYQFMVPIVGIFAADVILFAPVTKSQVLMNYHLFEQDDSYAEFNYDEYFPTEYIAGQDADQAVDGSTTTRKAQSFQVSSTTNLTAVELLMKKNAGTTAELTVRIETDNAGKPSGTLIDAGATGTIAAFSNTDYRYKRVIFNSGSSSITLAANTTYWIVCQHTTEGSGTSQYYWGSDSSSPSYSNGSMASYSGGTWTADATKDLMFRVIGWTGYNKYFLTKEYPLGDPQKNKKIKKLFVEVDEESEAQSVTVTLYNQNQEKSKTYTIDTSTFDDPHPNFLKGQNFKARRFSVKFSNSVIKENFKINGFEINYAQINSLK